MKLNGPINALFKGLQPSTFTVLMVLAPVIGLLAAPHAVHSQNSSDHMPPNLTIFIVRHAEKPAQGDDLAPDGAARTQAYVKYFQGQVKYDGQPIRWTFLFASAESGKSNRPSSLRPLAEAIHLNISGEFKNTSTT